MTVKNLQFSWSDQTAKEDWLDTSKIPNLDVHLTRAAQTNQERANETEDRQAIDAFLKEADLWDGLDPRGNRNAALMAHHLKLRGIRHASKEQLMAVFKDLNSQGLLVERKLGQRMADNDFIASKEKK